MGTLFRIKLYAADEQQAHAAFRAAFDRIAELDAMLSDYKPDSELNRICRTAVGRPGQGQRGTVSRAGRRRRNSPGKPMARLM